MEQDQIMKRRIRPYPENVEHGVEGELRCVQGITSSNTVPPGSYVSLRQFWRIAALGEQQARTCQNLDRAERSSPRGIQVQRTIFPL
jgi:hypothetical protein